MGQSSAGVAGRRRRRTLHYSKYLLLLEFPRVIVESLPHRSFILLSSFSIITRFLAHNVSSQKAHSFLEVNA